MDRHIIIVTSDKRQEKLAALMEGERASYVWAEDSKRKEACEKIYVLPTPITKLDKNHLIKEKLKQELIKMGSRDDIKLKVFGGAINQEWKCFFESYEIPFLDFMKLPEVVEGNGWITAEATIAEVLQESEYSICGQSVLITGYGCCGEKIAKLFAKLGARVIVAARREAVREQIVKDGFIAIGFDDMKKHLIDISTVINTVPSLVITDECIRTMPSGSLIVDIASHPGGTDFGAAKKYGITAKLALGLPGIYTTSSSAMLLKNAISQYAPLRENVRGDKLWIFQIII